jgi:hypothetical protein
VRPGDRAVKELDPQAHFVAYTVPAMIAFRKEAYLEFSVTTTLPPNAVGSRYKMAALAFDDHISHLVRPVIAYFKAISISTASPSAPPFICKGNHRPPWLRLQATKLSSSSFPRSLCDTMKPTTARDSSLSITVPFSSMASG